MEGELARTKFKNLIQKVFSKYLFYNILSYAEVCIENEYKFNKFKKKVLDFGNNAMRFLQKQCDTIEIEEIEPILEEVFIYDEEEEEKEDESKEE